MNFSYDTKNEVVNGLGGEVEDAKEYMKDIDKVILATGNSLAYAALQQVVNGAEYFYSQSPSLTGTQVGKDFYNKLVSARAILAQKKELASQAVIARGQSTANKEEKKRQQGETVRASQGLAPLTLDPVKGSTLPEFEQPDIDNPGAVYTAVPEKEKKGMLGLILLVGAAGVGGYLMFKG